jgi:hypothetical protein
VFRQVCAAAAALVVAGCTPEIQLANAPPFSPEWCQAAKAFPRSGQQLLNVAKCHERGVAGFPAEDSLIVYYLNGSARWGDVEAGAQLARRGQPIPDDDLRREADVRRAQERNARIIADAIRPPAPPRGPHDSILFPGTGSSGPRIVPTSAAPPPPVRPAVQNPSFGGGRSGVSVQRENRTESVRRNCVNGVCKVERTVCVNGACTTTVSDR